MTLAEPLYRAVATCLPPAILLPVGVATRVESIATPLFLIGRIPIRTPSTLNTTWVPAGASRWPNFTVALNVTIWPWDAFDGRTFSFVVEVALCVATLLKPMPSPL